MNPNDLRWKTLLAALEDMRAGDASAVLAAFQVLVATLDEIAADLTVDAESRVAATAMVDDIEEASRAVVFGSIQSLRRRAESDDPDVREVVQQTLRKAAERMRELSIDVTRLVPGLRGTKPH